MSWGRITTQLESLICPAHVTASCATHTPAHVQRNNHVNSCLHIDFFIEYRPHIRQHIHRTQKAETFAEQISDPSCVGLQHTVEITMVKQNKGMTCFFYSSGLLAIMVNLKLNKAAQNPLWLQSSIVCTDTLEGASIYDSVPD